MDLNGVCCICYELLVIPVKPVCFSCVSTTQFNQLGKNCYSYTRICMRCADSFFQLDKPVNERKTTVKCLICSCKVNPSRLTRSTAYEIDFLFMRSIPNHDMSCPYCSSWKGSGNDELYHHISNDCDLFKWECPCGDLFTRQTLSEHQTTCPRHTTCSVCGQRVSDMSLTQHMSDNHGMTMCCSCRQFIALSSMTQHIINDCPERLICCDICMSLIRMRFFKEHVISHYSECRGKIRRLEGSLLTENQRLTNITTMCGNHGIDVPDEETTPLPIENATIINPMMIGVDNLDEMIRQSIVFPWITEDSKDEDEEVDSEP